MVASSCTEDEDGSGLPCYIEVGRSGAQRDKVGLKKAKR